MTDLLTHIQSLNAKTLEWVNEDPTGRGAGYLTEDIEHWTSYGIKTPEDFDKYMLKCNIVDLNKSIYGFKPSWLGLEDLTLDELQKELEELSNTPFYDDEDPEYDMLKYDDLYMNWMDAMDAQSEWENPGKELVFTNGCWS